MNDNFRKSQGHDKYNIQDSDYLRRKRMKWAHEQGNSNLFVDGGYEICFGITILYNLHISYQNYLEFSAMED